MNQELDQTEAPAPIEYATFKRVEKPKKTFFYRKRRQSEQFSDNPDKDIDEFMEVSQDGSGIFACYEEEAARLDPHKFEQIGVSDGKTYVRYIIKGGYKVGRQYPVEEVRRVLREAWRAELEAARGNFERPVAHNFHFMGAHKDATNVAEAVESMSRMAK